MRKPTSVKAIMLTMGLALGLIALPRVTLADNHVIVVTSTIQAAVDAAEPGDTVLVPAGIYQESVLVDKDEISIVGSRAAVIDASGFPFGIQVGTGTIADEPACPPLSVEDFSMKGLTIRNAEDTGLYLIGVDGFHISGGQYLDNEEYGPFPVCSRNGRIDFNFASGHKDAAIYVGDDDNVVVTKNVVTQSVIGVEIENSSNTVVEDNTLIGNTVGILVVVLPGLPMPFTENVSIQRNLIVNNNFPNPIPANSGDPVGLLPTGSGILNVGGDGLEVCDNFISGNDSVGLAIVENPVASSDPRIEPNPDGNEVRENVILRNGAAPDPERATTPGADIVYDGTGIGNCFADNIFEVDFPEGVTTLFPCP